MTDRNGSVRDIIRRDKEDTGVKFKEMAASIDVTIRVMVALHTKQSKNSFPIF